MSARVMFSVSAYRQAQYEQPKFSLGSVRALPSSDLLRVINPPETMATEVLMGFHHDGTLWVPDRSTIREALPHYWRKAWDRGKGRLWYTRAAGAELSDTPVRGLYAHCHLRDTDGYYIATVSFEPYLFTP